VQQDGHAAGLVVACARVDLDHRVGRSTLAQHGHAAVDLDPAGGDPVVGLAPRRHAAVGQQLGQAHAIRVGFRRAGRHPGRGFGGRDTAWAGGGRGCRA
jgi:hypothetical protein